MASKNALLGSILLILLSSVAATSSSNSGNAETDALMELKAALDPSGRAPALASWARGGYPCGRGDYFEGVSCDALGRVSVVSLQGRGLSGSVSPAVAMLPGLTGLYLHYNELRGAIPRELGDLPELSELYLGVNKLSGSIPVELGRLRRLQGERVLPVDGILVSYYSNASEYIICDLKNSFILPGTKVYFCS
jgi:hypothetical protein